VGYRHRDELAKLLGMAGIFEAKQVTKDWLVLTPEGLFDGSPGRGKE